MLLLLSKQIFCQNTVTKNIEIPVQQVTELYKGLKQNEYLKTRLQTTENTLKSADKLILEQEKSIESAKSIIVAKDEIIKTKDEIYNQENKASVEREYRLKNDVSLLQQEYKFLQDDSKRQQRKKLWNGIAIGSGIGIIATLASILIVNQ